MAGGRSGVRAGVRAGSDPFRARFWGIPPPPGLLRIFSLAAKRHLISGLQQVRGKILMSKNLDVENRMAKSQDGTMRSRRSVTASTMITRLRSRVKVGRHRVGLWESEGRGLRAEEISHDPKVGLSAPPGRLSPRAFEGPRSKKRRINSPQRTLRGFSGNRSYRS